MCQTHQEPKIIILGLVILLPKKKKLKKYRHNKSICILDICHNAIL